MSLRSRRLTAVAVDRAVVRPARVIRVQWREVFVVVGILIVTAALGVISLEAGGWLDERDSAQGSLVQAGEVIEAQQDRATSEGRTPVAVPTGLASAITAAAGSASSPVPSLVTITERGPDGAVITRTITATTTLPGLPATTITSREIVTDSRTTTLPAGPPPPPVVVTVTTTSTAPGAPPVTVTTTETLPAPPPAVVTVTETTTAPGPPAETVTAPAPPAETITVTVTPDPGPVEQTDQPTDPPTD